MGTGWRGGRRFGAARCCWCSLPGSSGPPSPASSGSRSTARWTPAGSSSRRRIAPRLLPTPSRSTRRPRRVWRRANFARRSTAAAPHCTTAPAIGSFRQWSGSCSGHALGTGGGASVVSQPVYVDRDLTAYSGASLIGSYRSRCAVNPDDPYCRGGGGFGSSGGFVYASSGGGRGSSSSSSVWSSKSYTVESVRTTVMRGGFGSSASSAPSFSSSVASAPYASSSSSVARGGFGSTAAAHGAGAG